MREAPSYVIYVPGVGYFKDQGNVRVTTGYTRDPEKGRSYPSLAEAMHAYARHRLNEEWSGVTVRRVTPVHVVAHYEAEDL